MTDLISTTASTLDHPAVAGRDTHTQAEVVVNHLIARGYLPGVPDAPVASGDATGNNSDSTKHDPTHTR